MWTSTREGSAAVRFGSRIVEQVQTAVDRSVLGTVFLGRSAIGTADREADTGSDPSPFEESVSGSTLRRTITSIRQRVLTAASNARVTSSGTTLQRYVMSSFAYRWLIAEPESDVIVIDLRETKTTGPIVSAVDVVLDTLTAAIPTATVAAVAAKVGRRFRRRLEPLLETRPVQLLVAAFEPPEPPEATSYTGDDSSEADDGSNVKPD